MIVKEVIRNLVAFSPFDTKSILKFVFINKKLSLVKGEITTSVQKQPSLYVELNSCYINEIPL